MAGITKTLTFLFVLSISILGCTGTRSSINHAPQTGLSGVFNISEEQADKIILKSLNEVMSGSPISIITSPYKGYQSTMRFFLDSHTITAFMLPVNLFDSQGNKISGYSFQVRDSGTMPISGSIRAEKLLNKIIDYARAESEIVIPGKKPLSKSESGLSHRLKQLKEAYKNGLISNEEYESKRKDIIESY